MQAGEWASPRQRGDREDRHWETGTFSRKDANEVSKPQVTESDRAGVPLKADWQCQLHSKADSDFPLLNCSFFKKKLLWTLCNINGASLAILKRVQFSGIKCFTLWSNHYHYPCPGLFNHPRLKKQYLLSFPSTTHLTSTLPVSMNLPILGTICKRDNTMIVLLCLAYFI